MGSSCKREASPVDLIWGIGLDENATDIKNPLVWSGTNLLGFILMEVRDDLELYMD
ncbi:NADAR domain-containing protein [Lachnotalea glycerini]|uniref:NADAR domain-containing protein n=1 Tax=Lachnotalea glycerini TaxID=1763509 RepID=UPI001FA89DAA|nr:NADAR domain-containing protein [Lachnotalea glycerini]